jgi:hypothetical protein
LAEKQKESFDSYIEGLKKKYKVEVNKEAVSKLAAPGEKEGATKEMPEQQEPKEESKQK